MPGHSIAVLIPCYNEALTIAKVVDDFHAALPQATIYVYDNNSTDDTATIAAAHGAVVHYEPRQGKGNVVRQMFRDIEADCYLMVDGDDTYPAESAPALCAPILNGTADMTVGDRLSNGTYAQENKRAGHGFGNNLVRAMIKWIYGYGFEDVMTGYRAFSRVFVKTCPVLSAGFQIETEFSIHAVDRRWRIVDVPIVYRDRPEGSVSKLNTVSDGARMSMAIASLFKNYRPLKFFSLVALILLAAGLYRGHSGYSRVLQHRTRRTLPHRHPCGRFRLFGESRLLCWTHPRHRCQERAARMGARRLSRNESRDEQIRKPKRCYRDVTFAQRRSNTNRSVSYHKMKAPASRHSRLRGMPPSAGRSARQ